MGEENSSFSAMKPSQSVKTITVFSLRGGVGKTTLAANLAIALAQMGNSTVGLLDLALDTLHCSLLLDLRPKNYLTNLVDWPDNQLSSNEVDDLLS
ncbi:MAG: P-loop NTPase, partial [Anaerolineaceae bacterium]|nr:P-loop NTPase [Anaerolineaceae bacterium]